jgi:hypothetical protein
MQAHRKDTHIETLHYLADGRIETYEFLEDIDKILNLNLPTLRESRKAALDGFINALSKKFGGKGNWSSKKLLKELEKIAKDLPLREFSGMFEWWLKKKL